MTEILATNAFSLNLHLATSPINCQTALQIKKSPTHSQPAEVPEITFQPHMSCEFIMRVSQMRKPSHWRGPLSNILIDRLNA